MTPLEDLALAFYAPGKVGVKYGTTEKVVSPLNVASRILVLVVIPALGFGWVLLYALAGATSFSLTLRYGNIVDLDFVTMHPLLLVLVLAALVAVTFWFIPMMLFFAFNAPNPRNRAAIKGGFFTKFVAASTGSFGIHYAFLAVIFWLMTSQATFFWGMRSIEDTAFSITLVTSLTFQLVSLFVISKNYFASGRGGSTVALLVIVVALVALLLLGFT